jgi:hypothetical protein
MKEEKKRKMYKHILIVITLDKLLSRWVIKKNGEVIFRIDKEK